MLPGSTGADATGSRVKEQPLGFQGRVIGCSLLFLSVKRIVALAASPGAFRSGEFMISVFMAILAQSNEAITASPLFDKAA